MARNCEKKLIGLNRLWLEKQQKDELEKNPKRPNLRSLNTASEVKKWIPGIKREIDYCLDQISGARQHRYPDTKIKEFETKVEELEKEYKRFVNKVYKLDPSTTGVPWQPRGYISKRKAMASPANEATFKKICTPILDKEHQLDDRVENDATTSTRGDKADEQSIELTQRIRARDLAVTSKRNKDNSESTELPEKQDIVDVQHKSILGLDYSSSSDSDVS